jgi:hypothetical protein
MIIDTLDQIFPKGYTKTQGNHENMEDINIESQNHDYSPLQDPNHQGLTSTPSREKFRGYISPMG